MATKPKAKRPRSRASKQVDEPTDDERLRNDVALIRQRLSEWLAPFIEGPLSARGDDGYALRLNDGPQWYRDKSGLSDQKQKKLSHLKQVAKDVNVIEGELIDVSRIYLPRFFWAALRIGQYAQRARTFIDADNHNSGGRGSLLTDDQVIQVRIARGKGRAVKTLAKDYKVSEDTIYRALKAVSQK